jgi:hypothetical protein
MSGMHSLPQLPLQFGKFPPATLKNLTIVQSSSGYKDLEMAEFQIEISLRRIRNAVGRAFEAIDYEPPRLLRCRQSLRDIATRATAPVWPGNDAAEPYGSS